MCFSSVCGLKELPDSKAETVYGYHYGNPQNRIHLMKTPLQLMRDIVRVTDKYARRVRERVAQECSWIGSMS